MEVLKKSIVIIYVILVIALAFVKSYNSWYMITLWGSLSLLGAIYLFIRAKRKTTLLLHLSFLVILAGATVTHFTQKKGTIHLREGEPMAYFLDEEERIYKFSYQLRLDSFEIEYEADGKEERDYLSYVTVLPSGEHHVISMNNILHLGQSRFYQSSYDEDRRGSILIVNRDPYGIPVTYAGYLMMGISFLLIILRKGNRRILLGALGLTAIVIALFSLKKYDMPVLKTWLLPVHVSLIISSYVLLLLSIWKRRVLPIAIAFLACGIFVGAYWANISWGTYWSWDPKEVWALITMMVYAAPLHTTSLPRFRSDRFYRIYMILAFLCVLMTYFGVNYLLGGMHSYN
ncbi:MAG: cytochrome c biogenesis protein CcsA [Prevotella sp.]|nr:cytochrome c biogenesis protein CcsA [Candidatus Prevotella equi]